MTALTPEDWQTIRHALSVARARYFDDVTELRQNVFAGSRRLADQFARQIFEVDAVLSKLDDAEK